MKLTEFCNKQRRLIAEFERIWVLNHTKDPDNWPLDDLWEGEWEEQFQMMDLTGAVKPLEEIK